MKSIYRKIYSDLQYNVRDRGFINTNNKIRYSTSDKLSQLVFNKLMQIKEGIRITIWNKI